MKPLLHSGVFWILVTEVCFALMRMATRWGAVDLPGWEIGGVRFLGGALVAWGLGRGRGGRYCCPSPYSSPSGPAPNRSNGRVNDTLQRPSRPPGPIGQA
jgi:drug/metabolite transporter (DMT)-like permease